MLRPDLWSNPEQTRKPGQELSALRSQVESFAGLKRQIDDLMVLAILAGDDPTGLDAGELAVEAQQAHQRLQHFELMTLRGTSTTLRGAGKIVKPRTRNRGGRCRT